MTAPHTQSHWVGILAPAAPAGTTTPSTLVLTVILLIAISALAALYYRRPLPRAKRALRRIARDLQRSHLETRGACFRVKDCLRQGFGRHGLHSVPWGPHTQMDWRLYLNRLGHCCFAAEPPSVVELEEVVREAIAWLDRKRTTGDAAPYD